MPLTEVVVRSAKPREKPYKLADGLGMYLLVSPNGSRLWRLKYRFGGKEKLLALGAIQDTQSGKSLHRKRCCRNSVRGRFHNRGNSRGVNTLAFKA